MDHSVQTISYRTMEKILTDGFTDAALCFKSCRIGPHLSASDPPRTPSVPQSTPTFQNGSELNDTGYVTTPHPALYAPGLLPYI